MYLNINFYFLVIKDERIAFSKEEKGKGQTKRGMVLIFFLGHMKSSSK